MIFNQSKNIFKQISKLTLQAKPLHNNSIKQFSQESNNNNEEYKNQSDEEEEIEEPYEKERENELISLYTIQYLEDDRIPGYATEEGTQNYAMRNKSSMSKYHFREPFDSEMKLSSLSMGSYAYTYDEIDKLLVFNSYIDAIQSGGINVLDTSINSMGMQGERVLGSVLRYLKESQNISREELFISTKHGKITEDTDQGISGAKLIGQLLKDKKIKESDIVERKCFHPNFLEYQFNTSLANMGIECLDLVYLNDPKENHLGREVFYDKIAKAFEFYESKIQQGQLRNYGLESWQGFRSQQNEEQVHIEIQQLVDIAEKVGGKNHSFKWIQFPMSFLMPEALTDKQQNIVVSREEGQEPEFEKTTIFESACKHKINVHTKSSLMGGAAIGEELSQKYLKQESNIARHIQFCRSTPSVAYLSCVLGTDIEEMIRQKLEVLKFDPVTEDEMFRFYKKNKIKIGKLQ